MRQSQHKGFGFVEIIIATAIITIVITAFALAIRANIFLSSKNSDQNQAALLTEEASEALQILRDQGWTSNIDSKTTETQYYLYWNGSSYTLTNTPTETNNGFWVQIIFDEVYRDTNDVITTTGGTVDTDTRLVTIRVYKNSGAILLQETQGLIHNSYE